MCASSGKTLAMSALGKTWILDLDGTIVKHNGYKIDGHDTLLEGAKEFLGTIGESDMVVFVTSRTERDLSSKIFFGSFHLITDFFKK